MSRRRHALKALSAAGPALPSASAQQHSHATEPFVEVKAAAKPRLFTAEELEMVKILVT
jgi:hypothetical protein